MSDLTTVAAVKAYAGVTGSADDALLASLVSAYSAYVQQWLNRNILTASYTRSFNGRDHTAQMLPQWPVQSVQSVTVDGIAIPARVLITDNGFNTDGMSVILQGYCFSKGRANVQIAWTAGYATVPLELAQAVNELVTLRYKLRDKMEWSSKSLAGETVSLVTKDMPDSVKTILNNWRAVVPVC
jgi:uncharacterized phiE125 gp8 family phage protein